MEGAGALLSPLVTGAILVHLEVLKGQFRNYFLRLTPGTGTRHGSSFYSETMHQTAYVCDRGGSAHPTIH